MKLQASKLYFLRSRVFCFCQLYKVIEVTQSSGYWTLYLRLTAWYLKYIYIFIYLYVYMYTCIYIYMHNYIYSFLKPTSCVTVSLFTSLAEWLSVRLRTKWLLNSFATVITETPQSGSILDQIRFLLLDGDHWTRPLFTS